LFSVWPIAPPFNPPPPSRLVFAPLAVRRGYFYIDDLAVCPFQGDGGSSARLADGLLSHLHQGQGLQERGRARIRLDPCAVRRRRNRSSEAAERRACCYGQRRGQWRSQWRWCRGRLGRRRRLLRVCGGGGVRGRVGCVGACPRQPKSLIAYSGPEWRNN